MADIFPVEHLLRKFRSMGAKDVLVKRLVPNNNSKNQIYLRGCDISSLSLIPMGEMELKPGTSKKAGEEGSGPILWCPVNLWWLSEDGRVCPAPNTKLILYPQYSEVRLSGFLKGGENAPNELLSYERRGQEPGRILVLAPLPDGRVVGCIFAASTQEAAAIVALPGEPYGVLQRYDVEPTSASSSKDALLRELGRISRLGWLHPVQLQKDGSRTPCSGPKCGGTTLETYLGILPNGYAKPDFHGWEIKTHGVKAWGKAPSSPITLMTPEPDGGFYFERGAADFILKYGYPAKNKIPGRINFGGRYCAGRLPDKNTGLRLVLDQFTDVKDFSNDGAVMLLDADDRIAASWSFLKLMNHWKEKHAKAAFVESMVKKHPEIMYRYGARVMLAEGGSFSSLLGAFASGKAFYDPGMKIIRDDSRILEKKYRSQFRITKNALSSLYATTTYAEV